MRARYQPVHQRRTVRFRCTSSPDEPARQPRKTKVDEHASIQDRSQTSKRQKPEAQFRRLQLIRPGRVASALRRAEVTVREQFSLAAVGRNENVQACYRANPSLPRHLLMEAADCGRLGRREKPRSTDNPEPRIHLPITGLRMTHRRLHSVENPLLDLDGSPDRKLVKPRRGHAMRAVPGSIPSLAGAG